MRFSLWLTAMLALALGGLGAGCASKPSGPAYVVSGGSSKKYAVTSSRSGAAAAPAPVTSANVRPQPILTPDTMVSGQVAFYDASGRFVVLNFPAGLMPKNGQTLFLYRNGLKVAELSVTGPQTDSNTVADLVQGDAQVGDEVRGE